jgi:tripartite ATP-independent transporter DctM subunit
MLDLDPSVIGLAGIALLLVLIFLNMQIASTMILVGFVGFAAIMGVQKSLENVAIVGISAVNRYEFAVIPLFVFMGIVVAEAGIGKEAYVTVRSWIGQIKGGLAMATIGACGLFAATTGSSMATAVTMGKVAYPEMKQLDYDPKLAIGCIAAGGSLGVLIPPSIAFIILAILTEVSVGKLFIAGIIPGVLEIIFYIITIYILCLRNPQLGPSGPRTTFKQKALSLGTTWPVVVLFLLVIGGIYLGVFTPSEAGGIGAFGALVIAFVRKKMSRTGFLSCFMESAKTAAIIIVLIIGANVFMRFLTITQIPFMASDFVAGLGASPYVIIAIILFMYIICGMFFDIYAVIVLTIPVIFPIIVNMGFDPIWWCVINVRIIEIGMITPPFGINLFALAGSTDASVGNLYRGVIPFIIADVLHVALLIAIPSLCTFLPSMM